MSNVGVGGCSWLSGVAFRVLIAVINISCRSLFLFRCPALPTPPPPPDISAEMGNSGCMYASDNRDNYAGIFKQSMGVRNRVGIIVFVISARQATQSGGIGSLE